MKKYIPAIMFLASLTYAPTASAKIPTNQTINPFIEQEFEIQIYDETASDENNESLDEKVTNGLHVIEEILEKNGLKGDEIQKKMTEIKCDLANHYFKLGAYLQNFGHQNDALEFYNVSQKICPTDTYKKAIEELSLKLINK